MLPQVSVVIPCRDAADWLETSLASVCHQQGVDLELVVVDDGSRDATAAIIHRCARESPFPLQLLQAGGRGVSTARNLGWRAARHPLIAFLDADDLALPGRLQRQAEWLLADPSRQQVLCGWQRIDGAGARITDVCPWQEGAGFSLREALRHKAVLPSAWMLRRGALETVGGFDPALAQAEDVDLLLRLARAGASGAWIEEVLCGYRVHGEAASRRARPQARGLSFVVERQLKALSHDPADQQLAAEVRYGTRAWLGWYAWICGDQPLALELWTTALGLSPFPPGLTWVHLAENVVRSAERIGVPAQLETLLASPLWRDLEHHWRRARDQPELWIAPARASELDWGAIHRGQVSMALLAWSQQFRAALLTAPGATSAAESPWHPANLRRWYRTQGPLGQLQQAVLAWSERLLQLPEQRADSLGLQRELARILLGWAALCWQEDRRPTHQRLEQSLAVQPSPEALRALARLQRQTSTGGSQALLQLAANHPNQTLGPAAGDPVPAREPEAALAFWEQPGWNADRCNGPQCQPCLDRLLTRWTASPRPHQLMHWQPASGSQELAKPWSTGTAERHLAMLEHGQAWLRAPDDNAWASTHAFTIADQTGTPLEAFSRRYPQPWPGACPFPQASPQPRPRGKPNPIEDTVLALVGLSAETYYHWLLEILPTLGWLATHHPECLGPDVLIWHNGGSADYVPETLQRCCGITPDRLLDARSHPWIQARTLLVVSPAPFGQPSEEAQHWLRSLYLPSPTTAPAMHPPRRLWLRRGASGRRPVLGEDEVLAKLQTDGIEAIDCGALSVQQQAQALAEASLVIAPHGGAMANLVFAAPGTTVLELHHPLYRPPYYQNLMNSRQLRYFSQPQPQRPPGLYRDLLFESPATEPILLEPSLVVPTVQSLLIEG